MILRGVELKNFGKFSERSFEFRRGLNLVVGPNEAGKSTLMEAIPAILFGVRDKERFLPWGRKVSCEAALVLESQGRTVRIERDLQTDRVSLTERDDMYHVLYSFEGKASPLGRSSEKSEYVSQVSRLLGVSEEDIFRASLFFGQGALEFSGAGGLAEKIRALLSGFAEVDYDQVLSSLSEDYFAITRENPWGKNKTRNRELDDLRERLTEIEKHWYEARNALSELDKLKERIGTLKEEIDHDRSEYAKGERYLEWVRNQWRLEDKEVSLRKDFDRVSRNAEKVALLKSECEEIRQEIVRTGLPKEMPDDLPLILSEAEKIRLEMVAIQKETAELRQTLLHSPPLPIKGTLIQTFLLATLAGVIYFLPDWKLISWSLCGAILSGCWARFVWRLVQLRTEKSRIKGQAQILERQREVAQGRLAALDDRFESVGLSPSAVEIVKMQKNLSRYRELADRLRESESALTVLEADEDLSAQKERLTRELAVVGERIEKQKPLQREGIIPLEELPGAEEKLAALAESIKSREEELLELIRREASLQGELSEIRILEEEGERLREREVVLTRHKDVIATGYELLASAVEDFRKTYLKRFASDIGKHLSFVTGSRYAEVKMEDDFSLSLRVGAGWRPLEHFSRGTEDAVYLALRLALTRHLSPGRKLPLFLDDPFVNLDQSRLGEAIRIIEVLSREHQVILFAHNETLLKKAARDRWHLITLGDVSMPRSINEQERSQDVGQLHLL